MNYPMNSVQCSGCHTTLSPCTGCPGRIEICQECRQIPKKLTRARQKMELHLRRHRIDVMAEYKAAMARGWRRKSKVPEA